MSPAKIKMQLSLQNIAPFSNLNKEIELNKLKTSIFANNGSGKTFLSRMFRLLDNQTEISADENGNIKTDKLISFDSNSSSFSFKITDKHNVVVEDFSLSLSKGVVPTIPKTHYIYHIFNEDYVEENIQILSYDKNSNIEGFILGKANIDVEDEEKLLTEHELQLKNEIEAVELSIATYLQENINDIRDIKRLKGYKELTYTNVFESISLPIEEEDKSFHDLLSDYNKIKSVPENLSDINEVKDIRYDPEYFTGLLERLSKKYDLSSLAEDFKSKIKNKQSFIESGLELLGDNSECPFCEQTLEIDASKLIDKYNEYLVDEEAKTISKFNLDIDLLNDIVKEVSASIRDNDKKVINFNDYKIKYIPSMVDEELTVLDSLALKNIIKNIIKLLETKVDDISISIIDTNEYFVEFVNELTSINSKIEINNKSILKINFKKNKISDESRRVRNAICRVTLNDLIIKHKDDVESIKNVTRLIDELNQQITSKLQKQKVSKKIKVAKTIKAVLNYFFADKYSLDEDTFRLVFNKNILKDGQAKDVLSAGEKNIIAFAYYLGDCHLKVENEDDYEHLFFVIDDPISSMDFNHVYTLSGVISNLKTLIGNIKQDKILILTHNSDFMRVLSGNKVVDTKLILRNNVISKFDNNLTVPYIPHLIDVHKISTKEIKPAHTTANSIRHIIETLVKFEYLNTKDNSIKLYIEEYFNKDRKTYVLIQDLSHGGWRTEQLPITDDDFVDVCKEVIKHISGKFKGQIEYCNNF